MGNVQKLAAEGKIKTDMSEWTAKDVAKADDLYDEMTLDEVADTLGIPRGTVYYWSRSGKISTENDHHALSQRKYTDEFIERVDTLYDLMPLSEIEDFLDGEIPEATMKSWLRKGWISTDVNWRARKNGATYKVQPMAVVHQVRSTDKTQAEVAEKYGIAESTVSRYMRLWREHKL